MKKSYFIILFLLVVQTFFLQAQTIQQVLEKLDNYNTLHPQEKVYLQLDKYAYTAGETIWFKAYTTIGINNLFSNLSGVAYVELIDPSEHKIDSLIIPLGFGVGIGDLTLSDTIVEGSYRLRAYTQWMRNSDPMYFYDRTIQITNGRTDNVITSTSFEEGEKNNIALVDLKTLSGVPMIKTSVRYEILDQGKSVEQKKATSDEHGILKIEIPKKYKSPLLKLRITKGDKSLVTKLILASNQENTSTVQLLPEGGKLLEGFVNTIGIKSINSRGLGRKATVYVMSGQDTVINSETNDLGMGAFNLFLTGNDSLNAFAKYDNGEKVQVKLPEIFKSGYSLQVNNHHVNKLYVQVNVSEELVNGNDIYFLVHHLGKVLFVSKQKVNKQEISFTMNKKEMPSGVITISILNDNYFPIVERPIFSFNKLNLLPLDISLNKQSYGFREKVEVGMEVISSDSLKISALAASVLNISKVQDNPYIAPNILSSLLLSADLQGYIESPGYYFENNELKTIDMDYLMLTQGWRNLDWSALDLDLKPKYSAEKSLTISGYTKKIGRSKAEPGAKVQMISTKNFMDFIDTISNEDGYFSFDNVLFADSARFMISAKNEKGKNNIDIVYNKPSLAEIGRNRNEAEVKWDINSLYKDELNHYNKYFSELERAGLKEKAIAIEEVVVRARKEPKVSKNSRNLNGPGNADQIISEDELSTCATLELCLTGRLMGVYWQGGVPINTRGNVPMQVVLDGMFIEPDQISMVSVADVESIEVLRNVSYTTLYGSEGANGLIIITTKTGESALRNYTPKGIITIQPQGFHIARDFYKADYEVKKGDIQDLRTTIHWEPTIVTDEYGKAKFDFYTADEKGNYLIVIEGLDLYGKICRFIKVIEIK